MSVVGRPAYDNNFIQGKGIENENEDSLSHLDVTVAVNPKISPRTHFVLASGPNHVMTANPMFYSEKALQKRAEKLKREQAAKAVAPRNSEPAKPKQNLQLIPQQSSNSDSPKGRRISAMAEMVLSSVDKEDDIVIEFMDTQDAITLASAMVKIQKVNSVPQNSQPQKPKQRTTEPPIPTSALTQSKTKTKTKQSKKAFSENGVVQVVPKIANSQTPKLPKLLHAGVTLELTLKAEDIKETISRQNSSLLDSAPSSESLKRSSRGSSMKRSSDSSRSSSKKNNKTRKSKLVVAPRRISERNISENVEIQQQEVEKKGFFKSLLGRMRSTSSVASKSGSVAQRDSTPSNLTMQKLSTEDFDVASTRMSTVIPGRVLVDSESLKTHKRNFSNELTLSRTCPAPRQSIRKTFD